VGRVFFVSGPFLYSCSASVVDDARASYSMVLTAGHCVIDKGKFGSNWLFFPAYDTSPAAWNDCAGSAYGCWVADALYVNSNFASQKRFNTTAVLNDFAFAIFGTGGKSDQLLEDVTGDSFGISFSGPSTGTTLTALGYPAGAPYDGTDLTYCRGPIGTDPATGGQTWSMACDMTGGSSGGGWLSGDPTTFGAALRSLNSYGYTGDNHMYGPKFTTTTQALYNAANSGPLTNTIVP
jgi:V8-like Glu-specific endopeptidase